MCFFRLCAVTVNVVDPFYFVRLHVFPHNRVSVHEEPGENIQKYTSQEQKAYALKWEINFDSPSSTHIFLHQPNARDSAH